MGVFESSRRDATGRRSTRRRWLALAPVTLTFAMLAPSAALARSTVCTVPGAPGSPAANAGPNDAAISWTAAADNGTTITAYIVRASSGPNTGESLATSGTATNATMGGLEGGAAVAFSIAAQSACGTGATASTSTVSPSGAASTYDTAVLGDAPAAYYRLSDPSGPVMTDSSAANADGSFGGSQQLNQQPGAIPNDPDGSVSTAGFAIGQATPNLPTGNAARTLEAWFKTQGPLCCSSPYEEIAGYGQTSTDGSFTVSVGTSSVLVSGYNDYKAVTTPRPIADGAWHLVTVTYDGAAAKAYIDGHLDGTVTLAGTLNAPPSTSLVLGTATGGQPNTSYFNGSVQDAAIYPSALTAARVQAHFTASGYTLPTAPAHVHAAFGGNNAAQVTWGVASASNTAIVDYLVSVTSGPNQGESQTVDGDATAVDMTGLAAGSATFQVQAFDAFGPGPKAKSNAYVVPGTATTYASSVIAKKPAAFYRLADSSTGGPTCSANAFVPAMADSSGHGETGIYQCAHLGQPGPLANDPATAAGDTTAGQNSLGTGVAPLDATTRPPQGNSARTVEVWTQSVQPPQSFGAMPLVSWGENGFAAGFGVFEPAPSEIVVSDSGNDLVFFTPYPLNDGAWHQVVATYDGAHVTLYVDGAPVGTQAFGAGVLTTQPGGVLVGAAPFTILGGCCAWQLGSTNLADVAVFGSAFTPRIVATQFAASGYAVPGTPTNPAATAGANAATITWTAPPAATPAVSGYVVTAVQGKRSANAVSVPGSSTSATITGLQGGEAYTFKVQALNEYGAGAVARSNSVSPTGAAKTYASTVLGDDPSAFYRLGDSSSTAMTDSSRNGITGRYNGSFPTLGVMPGAITNDSSATAVGNPSFSANAGEYGSALASMPPGNTSRTVEGWMQLGACSGSDCVNPIAAWGSGGTDTGFEVAEFGNARIDVAAGNDTQYFTAPYSLSDGAWHEVVVTYDGTMNLITLYVDGAKIGTASFAGTLNTQVSPLGIAQNAFDGNAQSSAPYHLDDVAVYPAALTATQVRKHYRASGNPAPALPVPAGAHHEF